MKKATDILCYAAKFAGKEATLEIFNGKEASSVPGYAELRQRIEQLSEAGKIPEIKHFVFGSDEKSVTQRIATFDNFYLFVDYGDTGLSLDQTGRTNHETNVAMTVALPISSTGSVNQAEIALIQDEALRILRLMYAAMKSDSKKEPWLRNFSDVVFIPFFAPELSSSHGWQMIFSTDFHL